MAANILPRGFRRRVARQKALNELQAEEQMRQLRDQQMTMQTLGMVAKGVGMAGELYGLADKVAPLFASKGDSSVWTPKGPQTTLEQDVSSAMAVAAGSAPGQAPGTAAGPAGPPGAPAQPSPPQGGPPPWMAQEPPAPVVTREVPPTTEGDMEREYQESAGLLLGDGPNAVPKMPAPLAGLRMPSQIRAAEGMTGVHNQMAMNERDLFQEKSGATADRFAGAMRQQQKGPLRSGFSSPVREEVSVAPSVPNLRGGSAAAAPVPHQGGQVQGGQAGAPGNPAPATPAAAAQEPSLLDIARQADQDVMPVRRYDTYHETAAAIKDAASRGDRETVKRLTENLRLSPLKDVAPKSLHDMITGAHLDKARAELAKLGEIDALYESRKAQAQASAHADNTRGDLNLFNIERGRRMMPHEEKQRRLQANAMEVDLETRGDRNLEDLRGKRIENDWAPRMKRSTLASQAEQRAASSQGRRHREALHPRDVARRDEDNFERALQQANAQGLSINPYYMRNGVKVEMTTDEQREHFARTGKLFGVYRPQGPYAEPPMPGAAKGRSPHAADSSATESRFLRSQSAAKERGLGKGNSSENPIKKAADLDAAVFDAKKKLRDIEGRLGSNRNISGAARSVLDRERADAVEQFKIKLGQKGYSEAEIADIVRQRLGR